MDDRLYGARQKHVFSIGVRVSRDNVCTAFGDGPTPSPVVFDTGRNRLRVPRSSQMPSRNDTAAIRTWASGEKRGTMNGLRAQGRAGFAAVGCSSVVEGRVGWEAMTAWAGLGWRSPARHVLAHDPGTFPPLRANDHPERARCPTSVNICWCAENSQRAGQEG